MVYFDLREAITSVSDLTICSTVEGMREKSVRAEDVINACLSRIEQYNPALNAINKLIIRGENDFSQSLPLSSIPIVVKDMIDVDGCPTTGGSPMFFGERVASQDAACVERLRKAGAFIIGKANTHEIALGVTGINPHLGTVHNPYDLGRISGGSSSGSAAAVAIGMAFAGIGTDTGGSVRIPAALCGVVGMKPTAGLISLRGVMPLSWNLDHVGVLTRTVSDCALLLSVLAGYDKEDPLSTRSRRHNYKDYLNSGICNWKVAVLDDYFCDIAPDVKENIDTAKTAIQELGAKITLVNLSWMQRYASSNALLVQADAAVYHRERLEGHPNWFGDDVRRRLLDGAAVTMHEYSHAKRTQIEFCRKMEVFFEDYDLLVKPTTPFSAPLIQETEAILAARQLTSFTSPYNLAGLPALSLPWGRSALGLPIGVQLVGKKWSESGILNAGHALEQFRDEYMY